MNKKKVFFVVYGGGHVNIVKEIYNVLKGNTNLEIVILGLTMADSVLSMADIPHKTISQYLFLFDKRDEIIACGKQFLGDNNNTLIKEIDTIVYHGISYLELEEKYGEMEARNMYENNGRAAFLPVNSMERILREEKPSVLVVTNSPRMEQASAMAANKLGIPVVRINDLPFMNEKLEYNATLCVMNEWAKKNICENKLVENDKVLVTGQPVFEADLNLNKAVVQEYVDRYKKNKKYLILYLGQKHNFEMKIVLDELAEILKTDKDLSVLFRPHPNDDYSYSKYEGNENFVVSNQGELKYLLKVSDVVITHFSTAGLQAALLDRPLICIDLFDNNPIKYNEYGIAVKVDNIEDLKYSIHECLDSTSMICNELRLGRKNFENAKNSTQNICDVITEIIASENNN